MAPVQEEICVEYSEGEMKHLWPIQLFAERSVEMVESDPYFNFYKFRITTKYQDCQTSMVMTSEDLRTLNEWFETQKKIEEVVAGKKGETKMTPNKPCTDPKCDDQVGFHAERKKTRAELIYKNNMACDRPRMTTSLARPSGDNSPELRTNSPEAIKKNNEWMTAILRAIRLGIEE